MALRNSLQAIAAVMIWLAGIAPASAWCVRGVESWDTLRVRAAPTPTAREIGHIPSSACNVAISGGCRGPWCPVRWQGRVGWSNATYLTRGGLLEWFTTPPSAVTSRYSPRYAPPYRERLVPQRIAARPRLAPPPTRAAPLQRAPAPITTAPITTATIIPPRPLPAAPPARPNVAQPPPAPSAAPPPPSPVAGPATAATVTLPAAEYPRDACVVDIATGETLKVRAGPGPDQALRFGYPAGACGVRITGPCANGWCPVDYRNYRGWTEQRHLK